MCHWSASMSVWRLTPQWNYQATDNVVMVPDLSSVFIVVCVKVASIQQNYWATDDVKIPDLSSVVAVYVCVKVCKYQVELPSNGRHSEDTWSIISLCCLCPVKWPSDGRRGEDTWSIINLYCSLCEVVSIQQNYWTTDSWYGEDTWSIISLCCLCMCEGLRVSSGITEWWTT